MHKCEINEQVVKFMYDFSCSYFHVLNFIHCYIKKVWFIIVRFQQTYKDVVDAGGETDWHVSGCVIPSHSGDGFLPQTKDVTMSLDSPQAFVQIWLIVPACHLLSHWHCVLIPNTPACLPWLTAMRLGSSSMSRRRGWARRPLKKRAKEIKWNGIK